MKVLVKGVKVLEKGNFYSKSTDKRSKSTGKGVKVLVKGVKVLVKGNFYSKSTDKRSKSTGKRELLQ